MKIVVPELGESLLEATVARWLKAEGDRIAAGEPLVELDTDKAAVAVGAPRSGVLAKILKAQGTDVRVGEEIGEIAEVGDSPPGAPNRSEEDAHARLQPIGSPPPPPREERVRLSRRRRTIAERLVEARRTAAMLTTFAEIDMTAVLEARKAHKQSFRERHGTDLGIVSFFVKAAVAALKLFPELNSELDGDELVIKRAYDIGIAVGARDGLVVPVIRDADEKSFAEIERSIDDFVRRASDGTLSVEDLRGGTFTITNGGVFGSLFSTPILNPPETGILGLHKIEDRPVAIAGRVEIRPMMYAALTYDHRVVDGREAVGFLVKVKELIEDPTALLLEG